MTAIRPLRTSSWFVELYSLGERIIATYTSKFIKKKVHTSVTIVYLVRAYEQTLGNSIESHMKRNGHDISRWLLGIIANDIRRWSCSVLKVQHPTPECTNPYNVQAC
ncbi:hypothetical protein VNO77_14950 [Canavalia gladiata]|uniref:Uncharacterized protein n=1 Tax=Canavalia gladiata TaxID=3824 RepID=A0AAN9QQZ9_CANGL